MRSMQRGCSFKPGYAKDMLITSQHFKLIWHATAPARFTAPC